MVDWLMGVDEVITENLNNRVVVDIRVVVEPLITFRVSIKLLDRDELTLID